VQQPGHGKFNKLMLFLTGVELRITHRISPHSANRPTADHGAVMFPAIQGSAIGTEAHSGDALIPKTDLRASNELY
jgi:hypothetical protein